MSQQKSTVPLWAKFEKTAIAVLEHPTLDAAAQKLGISRWTLYKYLRDPDFITVLDTIRAQAVAQSITMLAGQAERAAAVLLEVMDDTTAPSGCRLAAARAVLDLGRKQLVQYGDDGAAQVMRLHTARRLLDGGAQ